MAAQGTCLRAVLEEEVSNEVAPRAPISGRLALNFPASVHAR